MIPFWVALIPAVFSLGGIAYSLLCLLGVRDFLKQVQPRINSAFPVSILKPLKGTDPEMYESFRSHCLQEYPEYEILFGVNDDADPAVAFVKHLQEEFPDRAIRLVVCEAGTGVNRKVTNLAKMLELARYDHVLINDSDIRVPQNYLHKVMCWFSCARRIGMVTCLYRAVAGKTFWSKLESFGVTFDFIPATLAARYLEGRVYFGLGSTMAVTKKAVRDMGGLESIADYLADDYELGTRIADADYEVVIPRVVVETFVADYGFQGFLDHQMRWGRTVRSSRPGGYLGMVFTFSLFWAALTVALSLAAWWSMALLAIAVLLRVVLMLRVENKVMSESGVWGKMWMLPLRDLIAPFLWAMSLFGNRIVWRGEEFRLNKGKISREQT